MSEGIRSNVSTLVVAILSAVILGLGAATGLFILCSGVKASGPRILDVAVITGPPAARFQGLLSYPAFLEDKKLHVWIGTQNLRCILEKGDKIRVSYPGETDVYFDSVSLPSCADRIPK